MTKKEMNQLINNKGLTKEIIQGLTKLELSKLESALIDAEPSNYIDEMITLTINQIEALKDVKRGDDTKKVASSKKDKKPKAPKAPKASDDKKEPVKEDIKKDDTKPVKDSKKDTKKNTKKDAKDTKKDDTKDDNNTIVDFSKYTGYQLERIFRSPFSALNKDDKKIHTALNKEYENLKKGDRVAISVKGDVDNEYAIANCIIAFKDAVSAIAVDTETYSKYELNRINWAKKEIVKHTVLENGTVNTMILNVDKIK